MRGINKVILVGSLGANPLTKHYPNGNTYVQFSIATSEKYQDKTLAIGLRIQNGIALLHTVD